MKNGKLYYDKFLKENRYLNQVFFIIILKNDDIFFKRETLSKLGFKKRIIISIKFF